MSQNSNRRYQDHLFPFVSKMVDLGAELIRWRKLWTDDLDTVTGTITTTPVDGTDIVNKNYVDGVVTGTLTTVEAADGTPSYSPVTTIQFDEADGFVVTNPSAGVVRIDFVDPVVFSLTVREVDGTPSVANVTVLEFDQTDGFVVADQTGGVVRITLAAIPVTNLAGSFTDLGTTLTGSLPVADGGTGSTTAAGARTNLDVPSNAEAILDTLLNAKGDLISATAADTPAILTVGANDTVLTADSTTATGLKWAAAAAAGITVVQIVSGTSAGSSTASTTNVDVTGATLTITPTSTNSKILVLYSAQGTTTLVGGVNQALTIELFIAGVLATNGNRGVSAGSGAGGLQSSAGVAWTFLDSPASTDARIYKLQHRVISASSSCSTSNVQMVLIELLP